MTLANKITILRIFLIPAFLITFAFSQSWAAWACVAIIILSWITDAMDGWIARARNQVTTFGKFMDPLADKLFVMAVMLCFVAIGKIAVWIAVIVLLRDFVIDGIRTLAASEGRIIAANWWGKWKLFSQMIALASLCLDRIWDYSGGIVSIVLIYIMLTLTIVSGWTYLQANWKLLSFK